MRPYFIGIAGPSGAGKTTLTEALALKAQLLHPAVIAMDCYYRGLDHLTLTARRACNFDDPSLLDWDLLLKDMRVLHQEQAIHVPIYCFETYSRRHATTPLTPGAFVIIEGIFALYREELRELLDVKIFVNAPDDLCFERRLYRDTHHRCRTPQSVIEQYETTVRPGAQMFVLPTGKTADLILSGDQPLTKSVDAALGFIENSRLRTPQLA